MFRSPHSSALRLWMATWSIALVVVACAKVPITGRSQLNLIPDGEMLSMSAQQYQAFLKENKLSQDRARTEEVKRVGVRIQGAVERYFRENGMAKELQNYSWEFNLVENKELNAWCMSGGKVVFYTGILPVCKDEAGIAVVMGHEVAHAVAKHGSERMSQGLLAEMGGAALSTALSKEPERTQSLFLTAFGVGVQYGALLPFSRGQESEADHLGLVFMSMAGYDPETAVGFWERMASEKTGGAPPEFMSTHPSDATRIQKIRELLPEAKRYYRPAP
jgi:predicted Zn-dependent protease